MKSNYKAMSGKKRRWPKALLIAGVVILAVIISTVLVIRRTYELNLRPLSSSEQIQHVNIPTGSSVKEIAKILEDSKLIRASWAFEWYVRNNDALEALQAGTYPLRPNQSVQEIVSILTNGKVSTDLVTILPGQRIGEIESTLKNYGFDEKEIKSALDPSRYASHPALVDKPPGANLEGYIYPESFQKTAATKPDELIAASLDELQKILTPDLRAGIVRQGLTVHQGIILASIIEQEAGSNEDKPMIAQVFLKRLRENRRMESDPTAEYGAVIAGQPPSLSYDSPYNTYKYDGLPPGPIGNFSKSSLEAVINPSATDFLYFVADDEGQDKGKTFFSRTLQEHQQLTAEHCKVLCN